MIKTFCILAIAIASVLIFWRTDTSMSRDLVTPESSGRITKRVPGKFVIMRNESPSYVWRGIFTNHFSDYNFGKTGNVFSLAMNSTNTIMEENNRVFTTGKYYLVEASVAFARDDAPQEDFIMAVYQDNLILTNTISYSVADTPGTFNLASQHFSRGINSLLALDGFSIVLFGNLDGDPDTDSHFCQRQTTIIISEL